MACSRGKANPTDTTRLRLFADSGGYCAKCIEPLFVDTGSDTIHIGEMAHIFAASDSGPRAICDLSEAERGAYENLILLCPSCHTIIDKAESDFPDSTINEWKVTHKGRIAKVFGAMLYPDRAQARNVIEPLFQENRVIFDAYGPDNEYCVNPESEDAVKWKNKVRSKILPNNRKLLAIFDANRKHLTAAELLLVEEFRLHVDELEQRHLNVAAGMTARRFPIAVLELMKTQ